MRLDNLAQSHYVYKKSIEGVQARDELRPYNTRVYRDCRNVRITTCELGRVYYVRELALPVPGPGPCHGEILDGLEVFEDDAAGGGVLEAKGREEDDARVALLGGSALQGGEEQLDEQSVCDVVDAELVFVAVLG